MYCPEELANGLAQNRNGDRLRHSHARYRLYWATFGRTVTRQVGTPRSKSRLWKRMCRLRGAFRRWWLARVTPEVFGDDGQSAARPAVSEQG